MKDNKWYKDIKVPFLRSLIITNTVSRRDPCKCFLKSFVYDNDRMVWDTNKKYEEPLCDCFCYHSGSNDRKNVYTECHCKNDCPCETLGNIEQKVEI